MKCNSARNRKKKFKRKFPGIQAPNRNISLNLANEVRTAGVLIYRTPNINGKY
jgi:hypothetical protein